MYQSSYAFLNYIWSCHFVFILFTLIYTRMFVKLILLTLKFDNFNC